MKIRDILKMRMQSRMPHKNHEKKSYNNGSFISLNGTTNASWSAKNYASFAHEGFQKNPIAYRCIRMIAESTASVPIKLFIDKQEVTQHPLLNLLHKPSEGKAFADLLEQFYAFLQVSGNSYLELVEAGIDKFEIHNLRPDRIKIIPGRNGWPVAYEYAVNNQKVKFPIGIDKVCPILHLKLFHPLNDHYGMSPMETAGFGVDIHNAANAWNKALFDNAARPSGALVYKGVDGAQNLTDEQFDRLKNELETNYQGSHNAGRPLLLEGGLEWTPISLTPQDMDFIHAKHAAARDIALAFGIPPMLLGIPGDNTYANYIEANRAFWRQTVLPLAERTMRRIGQWLGPIFEKDHPIYLKCNMDALPALSEERAKLWERIGKAEFLTINEKREALGYPPVTDHNQVEL